jgi:CheY-like chemotaxis protein
MNILIVEDDAATRKAIGFYALEAGHSVTSSANGTEALALLEKNRSFRLVICDIMMPGLSGAGFLLGVKKIFRDKMPAVIVVSGVKDGEELLKKVEVGFDAFLKKPIDFRQLEKVIKEITGKIS